MDENENEQGDSIEDLHPIDCITLHFEQLIEELQARVKCDDRFPLGCHYAVVITETKKALAYFDYYIARAQPEDCANEPLDGVLYHRDVVDINHIRLTRVAE